MRMIDWLQVALFLAVVGASGAAMTWLLVWLGGLVTDGVVETTGVVTGKGRRRGIGAAAERRRGKYGIRTTRRRTQRALTRRHGPLHGLRD